MRRLWFRSALLGATINVNGSSAFQSALLHRLIPTIRRTTATTTSTRRNMGWATTWDDILQGGSQRWKVTEAECHQAALEIIQQFMRKPEISKSCNNNVLCPLAGDDPMVHLLWKQGHSVTAMDLVPAALEQMRSQFDGSWTREDRVDNGMVVWKHDSGRATQYQGDVLQKIDELTNSFDAIYDKDSFGALQKEMRKPFCARMSEYTKEDAIVYIEVKLRDNHEETKDMGPPFSLKQDDLMDSNCYGGAFDYVKGFGNVYPIAMSGMKQTAHILRRK